MQQILLSEIVESVKALLFDDNNSRHKGKVEVLIDNNNCFRAFIDWDRCIGEIIVDNPDFAPYRYISFNILSSDLEVSKSIYYWIDKEGDSLDYIKKKVCEGLKVADTY